MPLYHFSLGKIENLFGKKIMFPLGVKRNNLYLIPVYKNTH